MGPFFTINRSVKGLFFIQLWVCFRSVFLFLGPFLDLAALDTVESAETDETAETTETNC